MTSHSFNTNLATEYGVDAAILICHMQYWISHNKRLKRNFHEGRYWTYQTLDEICAHFPYFSKDQIRNILCLLCDGNTRRSEKDSSKIEPVLLKGNFNKTPFDRTTWYAFVDEDSFISNHPYEREISHIDGEASQMGKGQSPSTIPHTKQDTKTTHSKTTTTLPPQKSNETTSNENGGGGASLSSSESEIKYFSPGGEEKTVRVSEIYSRYVKSPFSTIVIEKAILEVQQSKDRIGNFWKYFDAICKRLSEDKSTISARNDAKIQPTVAPISTSKHVTFAETMAKMAEEEKELTPWQLKLQQHLMGTNKCNLAK